MMALAATLAAAFRVAMAMIFAQSAWHAGRDWPRHVGAVAAYWLVPAHVAPAAAFLVTAGNAIVALLLFYSPAAGCAGAILLLLYAGAMAINVRRGRTHIDCGCGTGGERISSVLVLRNVILGCGLGAAACAPASGYDVATIAAVAAVGGSALALAALYFAASQLLANHAAFIAEGERA